MKENQKEKKRFRLFNMNRDGKGVDKSEVEGPPNLKNFFKTFFRKFNKILSLNLLMWGRLPMYALVIGIVSFLLYEMGGIFETVFFTTASLLGKPVRIAESPIFGAVSGTQIASGSSPAASTLMSMFGGVTEVPAYSPLFFGVIIGLFAFVLVTWGWQSVGATYITRGLVRGDPVFIFSDYFHGIKKNLKKGFIIGLIDAVVLMLLTFDFCYLYISSTTIMSEILLFIIGGLIILYSIVRKYIYLLEITFDMKISKIFKNALIFSVLGIKRNLVGAVGSLLLLAVNTVLGILCMNFNFIIPLLLPLVYFIGTSYYISAYSTYPVIDKYMIEPYKKAHPDEFKPIDDEEDAGTEENGEPDSEV